MLNWRVSDPAAVVVHRQTHCPFVLFFDGSERRVKPDLTLSVPFSIKTGKQRQLEFLYRPIKNLWDSIKSGARPHHQPGIDELIEFLASCSRARLHTDSLHHRIEQVGERLDLDVRRKITFGLRPLEPLD